MGTVQEEKIKDHLIHKDFYDALMAWLNVHKDTADSALRKRDNDPLRKITKLLEASGERYALDQVCCGMEALRNEVLKEKGITPEG